MSNKITEVKEVQDVQDTGIEAVAKTSMISRFFKEKDTLQMEELINQFIEETQTLPFTSIEELEGQPGQIQVDIVQEFDDKMNELFDNSDELIGDYIQAMMMDMMEDPEAM